MRCAGAYRQQSEEQPDVREVLEEALDRGGVEAQAVGARRHVDDLVRVEARRARAVTKKKLKFTLPGPMTIIARGSCSSCAMPTLM